MVQRLLQSKARIWIFLAGAFVSGICLYLAFRKVDLGSFWDELRNIHPLSVLGAVMLANLHNFTHAARWMILLRQLGRCNYWQAYWSLRMAFFFNASLPARLGEAFRIWYVNKTTKIAATRVIGAMAADRLLDFATLFTLVYLAALVLGMRGVLPDDATISWIGLGILLALYLLTKIPKTSENSLLHKIYQIRLRVFEGLKAMKSSKVLVSTLPLSIFGWILEAACIVTLSYGLDHPISIFRALMVVAAVNVAVAIPSSPGNIGTFQLGAMTMLLFLDFPRSEAATIAVLYHLCQLLPTLVIGAYGYFHHFSKLPKPTQKDLIRPEY